MASEQVWVVAACFNEAEVISVFLERVMALPEMEHLLLIDDGSSDATEPMGLVKLRRTLGPSSSTRWCEWLRPCPLHHQAKAQQSVQQSHHAQCWGVLLQRCSRASMSRQACCS